jgi:hypothetical protein
MRSLRVIGNALFARDALIPGYFPLGYVTGHSYDLRGFVRQGESEIHVADRARALGNWSLTQSSARGLEINARGII